MNPKISYLPDATTLPPETAERRGGRMSTVSVACTDVGRRGNNEDVILARDDLGLYLVCDGIGGNAGGEVAAELTANVVEAMVEEELAARAAACDEPPTITFLLALVRNVMLTANRVVHFAARADRKHAHMGTTLTMVVVAGPHAVMGHVGDSRLYQLRDGRLIQSSRDHSAAQFLRDIGLISEAELDHHPQSNVLTRSIGHRDQLDPDVIALDLKPGDRLMLCSDGVSGYLPSRGWLAELLAAHDLSDAAECLVDTALDQGSRDNASAIVVRVESVDRAAGEAAA